MNPIIEWANQQTDKAEAELNDLDTALQELENAIDNLFKDLRKIAELEL